MRGRYDKYEDGHLIRRDVRQDHGSGPEVPRHKKRAIKKRKRVDHKHKYIEMPSEYYWDVEYVSVRCKICNKYNHKKTVYANKVRRANKARGK